MEKRREDIKISVIVPVYNSEKYLKKCVDSILSQTHGNLEVILVDDGSDDGSAGLCDQYEKADARVRVIHKTREGVCGARNKGLDIMEGDYVTFVDNDDFILPDMYELLLENMLKYQVPLSMCSYTLYYEEKGETRSEKKENLRVLDSLEALHVFHTDQRIDMIVPWNKLYKKELFEGIRYPVGRTFDDEFVTYRLLWKAGKICFTDRQCYFFRQREDSITHTRTLKKYTDYLDALLERNLFFAREVRDDALIKEDVLFCMEELCSIHFRQCPKQQYTFYHQEYVRMYEACELRKRLKPARRLRYFAAARCPGLLMGAWKLKKRLKR